MGSYATKVKIDAPKDRVWEVLSDFGSIYKWNPGITHSRTTSDQTSGVNTMRQCDLPDGGFLRERAIDWNEGESVKIEVYESTIPLHKSTVEFRVAADGDRTVVKLGIDYTLKYGPIGAVIDAAFAGRRLRTGMNELLAGLKDYVENVTQADQEPAEEAVTAGRIEAAQ